MSALATPALLASSPVTQTPSRRPAPAPVTPPRPLTAWDTPTSCAATARDMTYSWGNMHHACCSCGYLAWQHRTWSEQKSGNVSPGHSSLVTENMPRLSLSTGSPRTYILLDRAS